MKNVDAGSRVLAWILCGALTLPLAACKKNKKGTDGTDGTGDASASSTSQELDEQFIFACRNSCENDNQPDLKSGKTDVVSHGYGLLNIKEAVERNHGKCVFKKEEHEFVSVVIIPVQK